MVGNETNPDSRRAIVFLPYKAHERRPVRDTSVILERTPLVNSIPGVAYGLAVMRGTIDDDAIPTQEILSGSLRTRGLEPFYHSHLVGAHERDEARTRVDVFAANLHYLPTPKELSELGLYEATLDELIGLTQPDSVTDEVSYFGDITTVTAINALNTHLHASKF